MRNISNRWRQEIREYSDGIRSASIVACSSASVVVGLVCQQQVHIAARKRVTSDSYSG
jgi:hypothetical protein